MMSFAAARPLLLRAHVACACVALWLLNRFVAAKSLPL
jgi:hypothetical protein